MLNASRTNKISSQINCMFISHMLKNLLDLSMMYIHGNAIIVDEKAETANTRAANSNGHSKAASTVFAIGDQVFHSKL